MRSAPTTQHGARSGGKQSVQHGSARKKSTSSALTKGKTQQHGTKRRSVNTTGGNRDKDGVLHEPAP